MQTVRQSLRESARLRWIALAIVSFTMFCGYYFEKATSAFKPALESNAMGWVPWTSTQFGFFRFSYMWLNVFAGMLVIGGIILDKKGIRFAGVMATIIMVCGAAVCGGALWCGYWFTVPAEIWGVPLPFAGTWRFPVVTQMWVACCGFAVFCMGDEIAGITVSKTIVKWFKGKEMALAMGLEMASARMGTALAMACSLPIAIKWGVPAPVLMGVVLLTIGMGAFIGYTSMDRRLDASEPPAPVNESGEKEDAFKFSDILDIMKNRGFWLIAVLCVLFYSAVFPFLDYATDLMVNKYGLDAKYAGYIPAMLPLGNILLTPVFGSVYDRKGKGASIMALGAVLLIMVHVIFSVPALDHWGYAVFAVLILGVGFSLVPSAMWPSVPKLIPERQLGTAYAMIFFIQNIGLGLVPLLIGWVLDSFCKIGERLTESGSVPMYNYTWPMVVFTAFGVLALIVAMMLKTADRAKGYGLELPNIKK